MLGNAFNCFVILENSVIVNFNLIPLQSKMYSFWLDDEDAKHNIDKQKNEQSANLEKTNLSFLWYFERQLLKYCNQEKSEKPYLWLLKFSTKRVA